jgi:hypothetical protein
MNKNHVKIKNFYFKYIKKPKKKYEKKYFSKKFTSSLARRRIRTDAVHVHAARFMEGRVQVDVHHGLLGSAGHLF